MKIYIPALQIFPDSIQVSTPFIMSGQHFVVFNMFDYPETYLSPERELDKLAGTLADGEIICQCII
jgi:hypothetical protein